MTKWEKSGFLDNFTKNMRLTLVKECCNVKSLHKTADFVQFFHSILKKSCIFCFRKRVVFESKTTE